MQVAFDSFVYDDERRVLERGGRIVPLKPKAFAVLGLLLRERPRAISKAEILDRVWPSTFVSDATLASVLSEIRSALGVSPRSRAGWIRTVHGFGYAFAGEGDAVARSQPAPPSPWCLIKGRRRLPLPNGEHLVGRDLAAQVVVQSRSVSRRHARLVVAGTTLMVEDLESKNGTYIGSVRIDRAVVVRNGDTLRFGSVLMRARLNPPVDSTVTGA